MANRLELGVPALTTIVKDLFDNIFKEGNITESYFYINEANEPVFVIEETNKYQAH